MAISKLLRRRREAAERARKSVVTCGPKWGAYKGFSEGYCAPLHKKRTPTATDRYTSSHFITKKTLRNTSSIPNNAIIATTVPVASTVSVACNCERRWRLHYEYCKLIWSGVQRTEAVRQVCFNADISHSTLYRIIRKVEIMEVLAYRQKCVSNLYSKYDEMAVERFMREKGKDCKYMFSLREMAEWVREEFGVGSVHIVRKVMKKFKWKTARQGLKPILTDKHKAARLAWSTRCLSSSATCFGDSRTCYLHIDEKWFYLYHPSRRVHLPKGVTKYDDDVMFRCSSKTMIPKVMFLAAIGFPRAEHEFEGDIGIWPVTHKKIAKQSSKYHTAGDEYEEMVNMNTEHFISMMKELVIPAAVKKVGHWAKTIVLQIDSAGGHGVQKSKSALTFTTECGIKIETILQPTKSPDLNVLDLGAWYSLQVAVDKYKREYYSVEEVRAIKKPAHRIIEIVKGTWEEWVKQKKIGKLFRSVWFVMQKIVQEGGNNNFEVPHIKADSVTLYE